MLSTKHVHRILFALTLLVGITHVWSVRYQIRPDGVSYIDMAHAISSGDWHTARNATWSPGYPALIAIILFLTKSVSSLGRDWMAAHAANFIFYVLALIAFVRFWYEVGARKGPHDESIGTVAATCWTMLGFVLFAFTFAPILDVVTPDLGVAAIIFTTGYLLLRWTREQPTLRSAVTFGFVLAIGYFVKAVLFPMGLAILVVLGLFALLHRSGFSQVVLAGITFLVVASPLIALISQVSGHLSFSESGRLVYAWNVNGVTFDEYSKIPIGTRQLSRPATYATPVRPGVTYAPWYDPSILGRNIKGKMHPVQQLKVLYRNYKILRDTMLLQFGALTFAAILLLVVNRTTALQRTWPVAFYALCGLGLYSAILIEVRYIGAFILLFWGACFGSLVFPSDSQPKFFGSKVLLVATVLITFLALPTFVSLLNAHTVPSTPLSVAEEISQFDLNPGDRVAVIGDGAWQAWPQPLHLAISGEVPQSQSSLFWSDRERQLEALRVLRATEAKIAVGFPPAGTALLGWHCSSTTGYCYYDLRKLDPGASIRQDPLPGSHHNQL